MHQLIWVCTTISEWVLIRYLGEMRVKHTQENVWYEVGEHASCFDSIQDGHIQESHFTPDLNFVVLNWDLSYHMVYGTTVLISLDLSVIIKKVSCELFDVVAGIILFLDVILSREGFGHKMDSHNVIQVRFHVSWDIINIWVLGWDHPEICAHAASVVKVACFGTKSNLI